MATSLQEAELCGLRQATTTHNNNNPPPNQGPKPLFFNHVQACPYLCPDGSFYIQQVQAGEFVATSQSAADEQAAAYACQLAALNVYCISALAPSTAPEGVPYSGTITISGGFGPFTPELVSLLPPGLTVSQSADSRTIFVKGTPTANGTFPFTMLFFDSLGNVVQKTFTLTVTASLWGKLVWDMSGDIGPGPGCPTGTMIDTTAGNKVNCLAVSTCGSPFNGVVNAGPVGTVSYEGPALLAHVSLTMAFTNNDVNSNNGFTVFYDLGGPNQQTLVQFVNANGHFEIDFTVPNSPTPKTLSVFVTASASQNAVSAPDTVSVVATLTPA